MSNEIRETEKKITHGRHCTCSACAREDWTQPWIAPCGMHGSSCAREYQPWGLAGTCVMSNETRETEKDVREAWKPLLGAKLDAMTLHDDTGDAEDEGYMAAVNELRDWMEHGDET